MVNIMKNASFVLSKAEWKKVLDEPHLAAKIGRVNGPFINL